MKRALLLIVVAACGSSNRDEPAHERKPDPFARPSPKAPPDAAADPMPPSADPDYPTPRRAGTEDLFFIEEPMRGPHVTKLAMPDRSKLKIQSRAYCEIDELTVVCTEEPPTAKDRTSVSVGTLNGKLALVEWKRGKHVDQTVVLSYNTAGELERMARLDETGTIDWVRTYAPAGKRYTSRRLTGANALEGCGMIDLAIDNGRVTARTCLQWLGDEMRDTNGVVRTEYDRDQDGFVITERRLAFAGRLIDGTRDFVHRIDTRRDARGRPISERYQAVAGHPVGNADEFGCAGEDYAYDRNQLSKQTCIDDLGQVAPDEDGVVYWVPTYDADGCEIKTRYLDGYSQPATREGVHEYRTTVDAHCFTTSSRCFDTGGQPTACGPNQPAGYQYVRDDHGWITGTAYIALDGGAGVDASYGASEMRYAYDALGNRTEESCFDLDGNPIECAGTGFHRFVDTFDGNGRATEERFYGPDGSVAANMGTVVRRMIYDNYDHLSESQDYDAQGQIQEVDGMAIKRNYYDDSHRLFGVILLDKQGQPARYASCYVAVTCPTDANGNPLPWHAVRLLRSPMGRVTSNVYFDRSGRSIYTTDCKTQQCWTE